MAFPTTLDELTAQGYRFTNDAACRYCPVRIEWWITPAGKKIPLEVDDHGRVTAHFASCSGYAASKSAVSHPRSK